MDSASLVEPLAAHAHLPALASLVRASALDAALARRADYASPKRLGAGSATGPGHIPEGLTSEDAETEFGNVLTILDKGATSPEERALLGALLALALKEAPPNDAEAESELGAQLVWLAAHTPCDSLGALDAALGADAAGLWQSVGRVALGGEGAPADFGLTEALVAAAALRASSSDEAQRQRVAALGRSLSPAVDAVLAPSPEELGGELWGELQPAPRGALLTVLLMPLLLLLALWRLILRYAFMYRRPASLRLGPQGIELYHRIELMGKVLRDRATVVPLTNLARVTRDVKYARAGLYVGLAALTIGTYVGVGRFVDGMRGPSLSPDLLGLGVLFVVAGLAVDFALSTAADNWRGRCRVVVVPRRGRTVCVGALDPPRADALLAALVERAREPEPPPAPPAPPAASEATSATVSA